MKSCIKLFLFLYFVGCESTKEITAASSGSSGDKGGKNDIEGSITGDEIQTVIKTNLGQIKRCYEIGLKNSALEGKIMVTFIIEKPGNVSSCRIKSSSLGSESVESCVCQKIQTWKFRELRGESNATAHVTYPFVLSLSKNK